GIGLFALTRRSPRHGVAVVQENSEPRRAESYHQTAELPERSLGRVRIQRRAHRRVFAALTGLGSVEPGVISSQLRACVAVGQQVGVTQRCEITLSAELGCGFFEALGRSTASSLPIAVQELQEPP